MCSKEEPALRKLVLRNEAIVACNIVEDNHVLACRESDVATTCCAPSVEVACTEGQHATSINTPVGVPCTSRDCSRQRKREQETMHYPSRSNR